MKQTIYCLLLALALVSCGTDSHHFRIDGRLLHLNQGEFYVYSPDGGLLGIDTIKVEAGRFSYEMQCDREMTLMIVFPNYTEQPIFAQPGKEADVKGDASHLKEMKVKGTKSNELMTQFREQILNVSPPEAKKYAQTFIEDHPESIVSTYLVSKYFVQCFEPDIATAARLVDKMIASQPANGALKRLKQQLSGTGSANVGTAVPTVKATDMNGNVVDKKRLTAAPLTVVVAWASWNYQSVNLLKQAEEAAKNSDGRVAVIGICLDASRCECKRSVERHDIESPVVCDEQMTGGNATLYRKLGMYDIPDNIIIEKGRIKASHLDSNELLKQIK